MEIGKRVLIRTQSAGVWVGTLKSRAGSELELADARRLWRWWGASECSQLAVEGVSKPAECKFPMEVANVLLLGVIEIHPLSAKADESIKGVQEWKA